MFIRLDWTKGRSLDVCCVEKNLAFQSIFRLGVGYPACFGLSYRDTNGQSLADWPGKGFTVAASVASYPITSAISLFTT